MRIWFAFLLLMVVTVSAEPPAARFELVSVPQVSQAASRLDNAVAPRFRDTAAAVTLILTMGATRYGMNLTRPSEIHFYSFGEKPAMRIIAYSLPEVKEPQSVGNMWGLRFRARRKGDLVVFDSEGVTEPFPADAPGKNLKAGELLRGTIRAEAVHRHFRFGSFNTRNASSHLILSGLDDLLAELQSAGVVFSADENALKLELTVRPKDHSSLQNWLKQPLPKTGKLQTIPGADLISVLRLNPTRTLREYGKNYLLQGKTKGLPESLPDAVTGFAVMAIRNTVTNPSARLAAGIDPARSGTLRQEIAKLGYTPWTGWFQLRKQPPLFCSGTEGQVIFCGMDQLDRAGLEDLFRPQNFQGSVPERPFICIDLKHPDRPLAELIFEKDGMRLVLQAPDSWFAGCTPLLENPLILPAGNRNP